MGTSLEDLAQGRAVDGQVPEERQHLRLGVDTGEEEILEGHREVDDLEERTAACPDQK